MRRHAQVFGGPAFTHGGHTSLAVAAAAKGLEGLLSVKVLSSRTATHRGELEDVQSSH